MAKGKEPTTKQQELLAQINQFFYEANDAVKNRREKWKKQYKYWINQAISETRPSYKSDVRANYCWVTTQVKIPVMTQNKPTVTFISFEKTPEAEEKATITSKLVGNALWNKLEVQDTLVDIIWDGMVYDAGFWKVGWDPSEDNGIGEVFVSSIEPFKILPDPSAKKLQKGRYVFHIEPYPVSYLRNKYKKFANQIQSDKSISSILFEGRLFADRKPTSASYTEDTEFVLERAYLKEVWIAPTECDLKIMEVVGQEEQQKEVEIEDEFGNVGTQLVMEMVDVKLPKYRNGRVVTIINENVVVDDKPNPYAHGKFPFVEQIVNRVGNEFWGMGDIEQIIPLQDALNHAYQQIDDIANKTANMGWTVHPGIGKDGLRKLAAKIDKPGALKVVDPNLLEADVAPQPPSYLIKRIEMLKREIEVVSGITDILQGSGRVRHRTARGLERIYESATSRIGLSIRFMESALKRVAFLMASTSQQFYTEERTFALIGSSGVATGRMSVSPEDLTGEYEVSIDSGASLPQDKQSKADLVFSLLSNQVFQMALSPDPLLKEQAKVILNTVEFPGREELLNFQPAPQPMMPGMPQSGGMPMPPQAPPMPGAPAGGLPMPPQAPPMPGAPQPGGLPPEVMEMAQTLGMKPEELIAMLANANQPQ